MSLVSTRNNTGQKLISRQDVVVVAGVLILFLPLSLDYFASTLNNADFSYCVLVPFVSGYIAYEKMKQRRVFSEKVSPWAVLLFSGCLLLYLFGVITHFALLARLCLVGTVIGFVWFNGGDEKLTFYSFPLFFLLFAVPPPTTLYSLLSLPLKLLVTDIATAILNVLGVVAVHEGNIIYLATEVLEVADACSGLRSMVSLATVAVLLSYYAGFSKVRGVLLTLCSVPIGLVANMGRVIFLSVMLERFAIDLVEGPGHNLVGVGVMVIGLLLLLGAARGLKRVGFGRKPDMGKASLL